LVKAGLGMAYISDKALLGEVLKALSKHKRESDAFFRAYLNCQVEQGDFPYLDVFWTVINERRGMTFGKGEKAVNAFREQEGELFGNIEGKVLENPETAHRELFEDLCDIPQVGQKIAATFLKLMVLYMGEWPQLEPYLFVPVDQNVQRMLAERLRIGNKIPMTARGINGRFYNKNGEPCAQYRRFRDFQKELKEAAQQVGLHRIQVDDLWLVDHVFCKPYPLCHACWIKHWCRNEKRQKRLMRVSLHESKKH